MRDERGERRVPQPAPAGDTGRSRRPGYNPVLDERGNAVSGPLR